MTRGAIDLNAAADCGRLAKAGREALVAWLEARQPPAEDDSAAAARALDVQGGREAGLALLRAIDPVAYARTRNHVDGAVTGLSPWIRHGVLGLTEVRDAALARVDRPEDAEKLISELAWREYWRQVHAALGAGIRADLEAPALLPRRQPVESVPDDVLAGRTGMACIDAFVRRLHDTGRLHNHERMWLASWLVHVRGVRWQAGADWFLRHLLDGDPASNHLSWQWVAGTFAAKPYLFNRENLERFTAGVHCRPCPLYGRCEVEASYETLTDRLFLGPPTTRTGPPPTLRGRQSRHFLPETPAPARPLVWVTLDAASPTNPAATAFPDAPRLFVLDPDWLTAERPSLKRLVFLFECLADLAGLLIIEGRPTILLPAVAAALGCDGIALSWTPCERVREAARAVTATLPVAVIDEPAVCDRARIDDLRRFSRFWQRVRGSAMRGPA